MRYYIINDQLHTKTPYKNYYNLKEALDILHQKAMDTSTSITVSINIEPDPIRDHLELMVCSACGLQLGIGDLSCPRCNSNEMEVVRVYDIDNEEDTNEI